MKLNNQTFILRFILIIVFCTLWLFIIPGTVAYKNHVFFGWQFKNKVDRKKILLNLGYISANTANDSSLNHKMLQEERLLNKVSYAGFADVGLNYVWLETYIILLTYQFIIFRTRLKLLFSRKTLVLTLLVIFLFHFPTWIRNFAALGQVGRTIYTFVNYDIDPVSFYLQEARGYFFSFLLVAYWVAFEKNNKLVFLKQANFYHTFNARSYMNFASLTKNVFANWQRDVLFSVILFLPWTWFYWRNIMFYNDTRYIYSAITFHTFWLVSIIVVSKSFLLLNYSTWRFKNQTKLKYYENKGNESLIKFIDSVEILPKGQIFFTTITAFASLISPFIQILFKLT